MAMEVPHTCWVAPGYEEVAERFTAGLPTFGHGGGAYSAYVGGTKVADLWGGFAREDSPWETGTSAVIMSASKGLMALCVQVLADRGQIDVDAPMATYWPEFASNGKGAVTVRHVLLHTAGLLGFPGQTELLRWDGEGWDDYDAIAQGFAAAPLSWPAGTRHGYHALSCGWLVGELVRRVTGRTLGTFFREEVGEPLGLQTWIGTPADRIGSVAAVIPLDTAGLPRWLLRFHAAAQEAARSGPLTSLAFLGGNGTSAFEQLGVLFANPRVLAAELPAGNATSTARSLARVFAMLACGGTLDGTRVLSTHSVERFARVELREPDVLTTEIAMPRLMGRDAPVPRTLGYLGNATMPGLPPRFGPNPDAFGVEGLGGQLAFADPANNVASAYVRNHLALVDLLGPQLNEALYRCAARAGGLANEAGRARRAGLADQLAAAYWRRLRRRTEAAQQRTTVAGA